MGTAMKTIKIKPIEIIGGCRAGITTDDEFQINGMRVENPRQSNICLLALSLLPPTVTQLQRENRCFAHISCPDCVSSLKQENCVTFLLGHADKWELCQLTSEYHQLWGECNDEPVQARQLRQEATHHQQSGEYTLATEKMKTALGILQRYTYI